MRIARPLPVRRAVGVGGARRIRPVVRRVDVGQVAVAGVDVLEGRVRHPVEELLVDELAAAASGRAGGRAGRAAPCRGRSSMRLPAICPPVPARRRHAERVEQLLLRELDDVLDAGELLRLARDRPVHHADQAVDLAVARGVVAPRALLAGPQVRVRRDHREHVREARLRVDRAEVVRRDPVGDRVLVGEPAARRDHPEEHRPEGLGDRVHLVLLGRAAGIAALPAQLAVADDDERRVRRASARRRRAGRDPARTRRSSGRAGPAASRRSPGSCAAAEPGRAPAGRRGARTRPPSSYSVSRV